MQLSLKVPYHTSFKHLTGFYRPGIYIYGGAATLRNYGVSQIVQNANL